MTVKQSIEKILEPVRREAMAAARELGLPARGTIELADHQTTWLRDVVIPDATDCAFYDFAMLTPVPLAHRFGALAVLGELLDPFAEIDEHTTFGDWIGIIESDLDQLRRALPKAARTIDEAAFRAWLKKEKLREQIGKLQKEFDGLNGSRRAA